MSDKELEPHEYKALAEYFAGIYACNDDDLIRTKSRINLALRANLADAMKHQNPDRNLSELPNSCEKKAWNPLTDQWY